MNNGPQAGQKNPLPKKESDLFKAVVKHYESKQYKKGIKAAENILKKFPQHGETLAMKGLTLNCMSKREEAHDYVRRGLRNDMRSHVCWHVYGLLYRTDRDYNEAIKAYKQALRIDPENLQILRDLSLLQIQMRDLNGFVITRHTILNLKPNNKVHWLAFALSKHLSGDLEGAISVIDCYIGTLNEGAPELRRCFESSELAMYRIMVLNEIPDNDKSVLEHLEKCKDLVTDMRAWLLAKGTALLKLGEHGRAKAIFMELFQRGSTEEYRVHSGLMCGILGLDKVTCDLAMKLEATDTLVTLIPLSSKQKACLLTVYKEVLGPMMPRSNVVKRIPLTLLEGDDLREALGTYIRRDLTKGVPFLGSDLSSLFVVENKPNGDTKHSQPAFVRVKDPADVRSHPIMGVIIDLVDSYISSLTISAKYPGEVDEELPSTILWAWFLRAQLHEMCGDYTEALSVIEKCIKHTPTAVDMYERKARILKLCGDTNLAADCLDSARELDLQDRYINNKTTKYMLRANRDNVARERISLFTRHEGNPEQNLYDMQCTWYELELAACYARKGDWGKCLKKFTAVEKHFEDFHEDQFDFHSYCLRKNTLRSYVEVLKFEDNLWGQNFYTQAASGLVNSYVHLFDNPKDGRAASEEPDYSSMTPAQRKKAKAIARKKKKQAEKVLAEKVLAESKSKEGDAGEKKGGKVEIDPDPNGESFLKLDPLVESKRYISTLVKNAPRALKTWVLSYDVSIRRGKKLMALQSLFRAKAIDPDDHEVFSRIVDFALKNSNATSEDKSPSGEVISSETKVLLGGLSLNEFVSTTAIKMKNDTLLDLPMRIALTKALIATKAPFEFDPGTIIVEGGLSARKASIGNCREALMCLQDLGESAVELKEAWVAKVRAKYPLATDFSANVKK